MVEQFLVGSVASFPAVISTNPLWLQISREDFDSINSRFSAWFFIKISWQECHRNCIRYGAVRPLLLPHLSFDDRRQLVPINPLRTDECPQRVGDDCPIILEGTRRSCLLRYLSEKERDLGLSCGDASAPICTFCLWTTQPQWGPTSRPQRLMKSLSRQKKANTRVFPCSVLSIK